MSPGHTDPTSAALNRRVSIIEKRLDGIDTDHLQRASVAHEKAIAITETALAVLRGRVEALERDARATPSSLPPAQAPTTLVGDPPQKRAIPRAGLLNLAERAEELMRADEAHGTAGIVMPCQVPGALRLHAQSIESVQEASTADRAWAPVGLDDLRTLAASLVRLALILDSSTGG